MAKLQPTLKRKELKQVTARDFGGGLNYVDSEYNLASKYAVAGYNMVSDDNGSLSVRWGTRLFADFSTVFTSRIVALEYYFSYVIAVSEDGQIAAADAAGTVTLIWSPAVAASLAGSPSGWGTTYRANFGQFLGSLIIVNGEDKPIIVDNTLAVQYLQDLGSGSNINTPITSLIINHSNYMIMAGDPNAPGRLYISCSGTSGTWSGDALPNDAIMFDVDKYAPDSIGEITGLASFRDRLIVFFSKYVVALRLGVYNSAVPPVHTPTVDDIVSSYGAVSHKGIINIGQQLLFLDYTGVSSMKQATFTQTLTPDRVSTLIDTGLQRAIGILPRATLQDSAFAVYDRREARILFFMPALVDTDPAQLMRVFVYSSHSGGKYAWSEYIGWNFQAGCVSVEGRVFLANNMKLYRHGSRYEPILSDYEGVVAYNGDADEYDNVMVYGVECLRTNLGQGIPFYHELPQNALQDRTAWKSLSYITMDTQGASRFTVSMFLDDLKKRTTGLSYGSGWSDGTVWSDGYGWYPLSYTYTTDTSVEYVGGDRASESVTVAATPTSGYRPTDNMGLYALYGRFRFFKMALSGTSYSHLRVVSISLYYSVGSIY